MRSHWRNGLIGGALMLFAYMIVVYALTLSPMAQIAALRESSVIFAAIMGVTILIALVFSAANLLVDLAYGLLNPKIRYE